MALTKITNDLLDLGSDSGALGLPKGTTAQRPSNPVEGTLRHNSEIDETKLETYNGTEWRKINAAIPSYSVDYLVIAGGGSGKSGGAGAGGLLYDTNYTLNISTQYIITIGSGGAGGSNGSNSSFSNLTAVGGGNGGQADQLNDAGNGGSGGGGGATSVPTNGGDGTPGQGNNGGSVISSTFYQNPYPSAGGGGAGEVGFPPAASNVSGAGGDGLQISITGSPTYYAGGGGGTNWVTSGTAGAGGLGGGGNGAVSNIGENGAANTGGGGGGYRGSVSTSTSNGGSGVVILRIPTSNYSGTTTGSPTVTTDGTDTILTYTSSGTYTA